MTTEGAPSSPYANKSVEIGYGGVRGFLDFSTDGSLTLTAELLFEILEHGGYSIGKIDDLPAYRRFNISSSASEVNS